MRVIIIRRMVTIVIIIIINTVTKHKQNKFMAQNASLGLLRLQLLGQVSHCLAAWLFPRHLWELREQLVVHQNHRDHAPSEFRAIKTSFDHVWVLLVELRSDLREFINTLAEKADADIERANVGEELALKQSAFDKLFVQSRDSILHPTPRPLSLETRLCLDETATPSLEHMVKLLRNEFGHLLHDGAPVNVEMMDLSCIAGRRRANEAGTGGIERCKSGCHARLFDVDAEQVRPVPGHDLLFLDRKALHHRQLLLEHLCLFLIVSSCKGSGLLFVDQ